MIEKIETGIAPSSAPISDAVRAGSHVWLVAIAEDPVTGDIVEGGIEEQTTRVLDNVEAVLSAAGVGFADIIKTTIFLADLSDFAKVNELYAARFAGDTSALPARSTVQVARLPRDSRVEIEVIAAKKA